MSLSQRLTAVSLLGRGMRYRLSSSLTREFRCGYFQGRDFPERYILYDNFEIISDGQQANNMCVATEQRKRMFPFWCRIHFSAVPVVHGHQIL